MSLSPWDLSGHIRLDVDQFRPRRASYVFATQLAGGGGSTRRARRESYRTATRTSDSSDGESLQRGESRLKRKESYRNATLAAERAEARELAAATAGAAAGAPVAAAAAADDDDANTYVPTTGLHAITTSAKSPGGPSLPNGLPSRSNGNNGSISNGGNHYSHYPCQGTNVSNKSKCLDNNLALPSSTTTGDHAAVKTVDSISDGVFLDDDWAMSADVEDTLRRYRKDVAVLATGFVLVFSSFRAIQNVESSLNSGPFRLGVMCMATVYGLTFLFCHLSPAIIGRLSTKRAMIVGLVTYMLWTAANCYPRYYTLLPASLCLGIGQSLTWDAMIVYARRRVSNYAAAVTFFYQPGTESSAAQNSAMLTDSGTEGERMKATAAASGTASASEATAATEDSSSSQLSVRTAREMSRFHNIFLASFQTSHIWGNLVSSLMLDGRIVSWSSSSSSSSGPAPGESLQTATPPCGAYELYRFMPGANATAGAVGALVSEVMTAKLMGTFMIFVLLGFILIFMFLSRVSSKKDGDHDDEFILQVAWRSVSQIGQQRGFRLLVPFLVFNGFQQGFMFADFAKSFVTCTLGVHYVGYVLMVFGVTSAVFSLLVGLAAHHIPRDTVVGIGAVLHLGLIVFLIVWQPDVTLVAVFFAIACLWGICDAIWLTQCSCLVSATWTGSQDVAFQNLRMFQSLGLAASFALAAFVGVTTKLYLLIGLLGLATTFYVAVEYTMRRRPDQRDTSSI